jgi:hypothetical protein
MRLPISTVQHVIKPRKVVARRLLFFRNYVSAAPDPAFPPPLLSDRGSYILIICYKLTNSAHR